MVSFLNQAGAVIALNITTIPRRLWMSIAAIAAVAIVVFILLFLQSMVAGMNAMMKGTGAEDVAIVLREGSEGELNSVVGRDQQRLIVEAPGIARDASGPIASPELYVTVDGIKKSTGTKANLPLRGVGPRAAELRGGLEIVAGEMMTPGTNEIIVGEEVQKQFAGFELGQEVQFGLTRWKVVGVFSLRGTAFESELWADAAVIQNLFNRGSSVQTVRVKLEKPGDVQPILNHFKDDPRLKLDVRTERDFFGKQSSITVGLVQFIAWPLATIMAIGALMGALNTMIASVESRTREIATLRTIGFGSGSTLLGTLAESLALSFIGGVIGAIAAYLAFNGFTRADLASSFTQVVYSFSVTPQLMVTGLILALVIGFVGGLPPAIRAAFIPLLAVHKE